MMTRSGHAGVVSSLAVSPSETSSSARRRRRVEQPLETALQDLAHHAVVVARGEVRRLDVELAVLVLDEAVGTGDDHRAHGVAALDVAVVVDLDPARRPRQFEHALQALEQAELRGIVGEFAAERFAGVGERMIDEILLLAAARHADLDLEAGLGGERGRKQLGLLDLVRQQDQLRRRLVVVELREERVEHFARRQAAVGAREVGAVAPVLAGAEEEHLDAGIAALLMDCEQVRFLERARIDALLRLDRRQRRQAIAIERGTLELEIGRGLLHLARKLFLHGPTLAGEKIFRFTHEVAVAGEIDFAGAWAGAALDLIEQARPGPALEEGIGAGADQEGALQRVDGAADGAGRRERTEIVARPRLRATVLQDLRRPVIAGQKDVRERFVVAQLHVEARAELLDQVGFEQQRFGLGRGRHDLDIDGRRDHALDPRRLAGRAGIGRQALAHALGLADVEHVALGTEHAIDAGAVRRVLDGAQDHGTARGERSLADRFVVFGCVRQPRLVLFLGRRRRRIDIVARDLAAALLVGDCSRAAVVIFRHALETRCCGVIRPLPECLSGTGILPNFRRSGSSYGAGSFDRARRPHPLRSR